MEKIAKKIPIGRPPKWKGAFCIFWRSIVRVISIVARDFFCGIKSTNLSISYRIIRGIAYRIFYFAAVFNIIIHKQDHRYKSIF